MLRQYMKHIKSIHLAQEASQSKNPKLGIFSISHLVVILYDRVQGSKLQFSAIFFSVLLPVSGPRYSYY